jgi:hypothetical protein
MFYETGDIDVVQGFIDFNWAWDVKGCQLQAICLNLERLHMEFGRGNLLWHYFPWK